MAVATFTAKTVQSTYFNPVQNIIQTGVATSNSTLAGKLETQVILQNWDNLLPMPINSMIADVQVIVSCRLDSGPTPTLNVQFEKNPNILTATISSGSLTNITLGGTTDSTLTWGGFFNPRDFITNGGFNVLTLWLTGSVGSTVSIDSVTVSVTYVTSSTYLLGGRSLYNSTDDGFIDNLSLVQNGNTLSNLVTSEDINRLGDCLVNIERIALSNKSFTLTGSEKSGTQFLYVATLTFTSLHATDWPNSLSFEVCRSGNFGLFNNSISKPGTTGLVTSNTPNGNSILNKIKLDFVSAIGWVDVAGTITPLVVSPKTLYIGTTNSLGFSNPEYFISANAIVASPTLQYSDFTYQNSKPKSTRFSFPAGIPDGSVTLKITGIGSE